MFTWYWYSCIIILYNIRAALGQELFYLWFTHRKYSFHISILLKNLLNRVTSFLILYKHFEYPIKYIGFISLSPSEKMPHLMTNEKKSEYRYFYSHSPAPGKISSLALRTKTYFKKNCEIDTGSLYLLNPSIHTPCPASGVPGCSLSEALSAFWSLTYPLLQTCSQDETFGLTKL